ncbi:MAG TPA: methylenetetrahydrofolate reductase C-terminal domain-containing protein [Desulfomonilaceae bacterium]|nr:methylenetetrahydrofolate reductase C-terminal domain-containing protein [Desulfomonilaceae bacterium]
MKTITRQKPFEEILENIAKDSSLFIVGCGTCATLCHTGGIDEVAAMADKLASAGKIVTGTAVPPTGCDEVTAEMRQSFKTELRVADAVLVMSCAFGVQTAASQLKKPVSPALDTLFMGKEGLPGQYSEICMQCGQCVLADTGGICPVTVCHKGLLNGPCGGTNNGMCEVGDGRECAWTLIYNRLSSQGRLDRMRRFFPPKNHNAVLRPGITNLIRSREEAARQ